MRDLARARSVEQQYGLGGSFCSLASSALVDDRRVDKGDRMPNEWRWQTVDGYIAGVQAVLDYEIARVCRLDGLLLGKNYLEGRREGRVSLMQRCVIDGAGSRTSQAKS